MRMIFVFFSLLLIPSASGVWISEEPKPVDFYLMDVSPQIIEPGETTLLTLTLKNLAPAVAFHMNATLDPDDISPIDVIGSKKVSIGKVKEAEEPDAYFGIIQNEDVLISMLVHVNKSTVEDVYNVPLVLYWEDGIRKHWTQTLHMGIQIKGKASIRIAKVSTSPVELRPDTEKNKVMIAVENLGKTAAKSVKADIELVKPFTEAYSGSSSDFVVQIPPDSSQELVLALDVEKDAIPGKYTLPLKITYRSHDTSFTVDDEVTLKISSKAKFEVENVTSDPSAIIPGDDFIVNVLIKNTGQERAENVKAVLKTKSYFTGVKTDYLGDIKVGERKLATFDLSADRDTIPDNYENDITLIWSEGDDRLEEITSFGITVFGRQNESGFPISAAAGLAVLAGTLVLVVRRKYK